MLNKLQVTAEEYKPRVGKTSSKELQLVVVVVTSLNGRGLEGFFFDIPSRLAKRLN